jgi:peptidoglycan/LPS O-acetylase OafA/YrhL
LTTAQRPTRRRDAAPATWIAPQPVEPAATPSVEPESAPTIGPADHAVRSAERARQTADALRHIPSLDGLRAVSVGLVFIAHAGLERIVPGGFGVTIFFFLSGFLITTLMRVEFEKNGHVNLGHFYLRRVLRILPPFYLVLLATSVAALVFDPPGTVSGAAVAAQGLQVTNYWLILNGYDGQPAGTGIYWSLAVEEHFYLLFPLLYIGMRRGGMSKRNQALLLWGLCAAILVWRAVLVHVLHASTERTYFGSDTRVDSILFGCALAVWHNPVLDRVRQSEGWWKWVLAPGAVLVLGLCLVVRDAAFRETLRYSLQGAALTIIFVAAIRYAHWLPFRVLNWRPLAFIGVLSYSLYLVHYAVIFAIERILPAWHPLARGVLAAVVSIAISWAIYRLIEKPCARLRKRLTD